MKHLGRAAVAILMAVGLIGTVRTWRITSRQPELAPATVPPAPAIDLATTLAEALQHKTVSYDDAAPDPEEQARAFDSLHAFLRTTFPRTLAMAERIAGHSLLVSLGPSPAVTIDGAAPVSGARAGGGSVGGTAPRSGSLLYAHLDVVPATADGWRADPFGGTRNGDAIIGRGALDDKGSVIAILAATESLLASGWIPARPVYLAFGDNEEAGGSSAAAIAQRLRDQGVQLESILDEGGAVVDKGIPGLGGRPIAAVAIAEKGVMNVEICAVAAPGHSSTPPPTTAVGTLSAAITRLEEQPPARSLNPLVRETLTYAAAEMSLGYRALMANLWLTAPLIKSQIEKDRVARAQLGTSQAVTMVRGGVKANVLPERACATVNYRLFPGDTRELVLGRIATITRGLDLEVSASTPVLPPSPSDLDSDSGRILGRTIRAHFPDAVIVPVVSPGATDSRHFGGIAGQIFRFLPVHLSSEDLASVHGVNEQISAASLARAYAFYLAYLRAIGQ
jgi:carboxypeptidase PM20D1